MVIETERLILRYLEEGDAQHMFKNWMGDPEVGHPAGRVPFQTVDDLQGHGKFDTVTL